MLLSCFPSLGSAWDASRRGQILSRQTQPPDLQGLLFSRSLTVVCLRLFTSDAAENQLGKKWLLNCIWLSDLEALHLTAMVWFDLIWFRVGKKVKQAVRARCLHGQSSKTLSCLPPAGLEAAQHRPPLVAQHQPSPAWALWNQICANTQILSPNGTNNAFSLCL